MDSLALEDRTILVHNMTLLQERISELEMALAQDSEGWTLLTGSKDTEFSRDALRQINRLARLFWLKNPLIRRACQIQSFYVFGQDFTLRANDPDVNEVVQAFMDDEKNRAELTSHQARSLKEQDLRLFGNLFFVFFINENTGRVRVRTLPVDEVDDIVCNPEDAKDPWFYLRSWQQENLDGEKTLQKRAYPDWHYTGEPHPDTVRGYTVDWDHPVYHVKTGCLSDMKFGLSEVYPALDWAKAYKAFLEDWATLTRAYSRFAHTLSLPSAKGVEAATARLNSTLGAASGETNPPPTTGSVFVGGPGVSLNPVRIGGANVSMEDGRRMLLMVAAAVGLPETFFGDTDIGSLATAKSLDRPTELQMKDRQTLWGDIHQNILTFAVRWAIQAGKLDGKVEDDVDDPDGSPTIVLPNNPETNEPRDATITTEWPPILEHDTNLRVGAIVDAATLKGSTPSGHLNPQTISRLLLQALGVDEVDALLTELYPPEEEGDEEDGDGPQDPDPNAPPEPEGEEDDSEDQDPEVEEEEEPVEESYPTTQEFALALRDVRQVLAEIIRQQALGDNDGHTD